MGRPKRGEQMIDAAIDQLSNYGFPRILVRKTIDDLLKLYGREGWVLLQEGSYRVVLDKLLEAQDVQHEQNNQKKEAIIANKETPPKTGAQMPEVHVESEATIESEIPNVSPTCGLADKDTPGPYYGWISQRDSKSGLDDMESTVKHMDLHAMARHDVIVQTPQGGLLSRTKRPSRWDVPHPSPQCDFFLRSKRSSGYKLGNVCTMIPQLDFIPRKKRTSGLESRNVYPPTPQHDLLRWKKRSSGITMGITQDDLVPRKKRSSGCKSWDVCPPCPREELLPYKKRRSRWKARDMHHSTLLGDLLPKNNQPNGEESWDVHHLTSQDGIVPKSNKLNGWDSWDVHSLTSPSELFTRSKQSNQCESMNMRHLAPQDDLLHKSEKSSGCDSWNVYPPIFLSGLITRTYGCESWDVCPLNFEGGLLPRSNRSRGWGSQDVQCHVGMGNFLPRRRRPSGWDVHPTNWSSVDFIKANTGR